MKLQFKRGFAVALCLAMVFGLLSGAFGVVSTVKAATPAADNLLANPSFEEVALSGWSAGAQTSAEKFAGKYALKLQDASATEAAESVSAPISVAKAAYIASAMVKSTGAVATIGIRYFDDAGNVLSYVVKESDPGATGWQELSVKATAPANAKTLSIVLGTTAAAQGAAYFDNVSLAATADTAIDPIVANGNFEGAWNTENGLPAGWNEGNVGDTNNREVVSTANGNHVLQLEKLAADTNRAAVNSGRFPITSGKVYNLSLNAKSVSGGATLLLQVYFYTAETGGSSQNVSSSYVLGNEWETIYLTGFAPDGYEYAYIDISVRNAVGAIQIDNVAFSLAKSEMLNASFEGAVATDGSPSGWSKSAAGTTGRHSVVSDAGRSGAALLLDKTTANGAVFSNYIPVVSGMTYNVTFYAKGDAVTSLSQVIPYYYTKSSALGTNSAALGTSIATAAKTITPTADWTPYTITFAVPADAIAVRMAFLTRGSNAGKIYFDDVTFGVSNALVTGCDAAGTWKSVPPSGGTVEFSPNGGPNGSACMTLNSNGQYIWPYQSVSLVGGQTYVVSGDFKMAQTATCPGLWVRLSAGGDQEETVNYTGAGSWQHFEWTVTVPAGVTSGNLNLISQGKTSDSISFANLAMTPVMIGSELVTVTNGDFEADALKQITGWYNRSGVSLSSDCASDGSWSVHYPVSGNQLWSGFISVKPGQKLVYSVDANTSVTAGVQVILYGYTESGDPTNYTLQYQGTLCAPTSPAKANNETWVTVTAEVTVPANVNYVRAMICTRGGDNNAYIDNVSLTCDHVFGTWVDEIPATHTANGTKGYKACTYCEKKFDANGNELTDLTISNEDHFVTPTTWTRDATHHWYKCPVNGCNVVIGTKEEHQYTDASDKICDVCLYERGCQHANMDNIDAVPEVHTETELKGAIAAHKKCLDCGKLFTLENTETTIQELTADAPTHAYGAWAHSQDGTKHERSCTCGKTESESHTGGTATCTDKKVCTVCNLAYGEKLGHNLTPVDAVAEKHTQTELVAGVAAHYKCGNCGKLYKDAAGTIEVTLAELTGETPTHAASSQWKGDADKHWYECSCGLKSEEGVHTPLDDDDRCDTPVLCSTCGQVVVAAKTHTYDNDCDEQCNNIDCLYVREAGHTLTAVPEKPATADKEGNEAYWTCECGKWFADAQAKNEITDKSSVVIDKLTGDNDNGNNGNTGDEDDDKIDEDEDDVPKTGDNMMIALVLTLLTLCGAVVIFVNTKFGFRK